MSLREGSNRTDTHQALTPQGRSERWRRSRRSCLTPSLPTDAACWSRAGKRLPAPMQLSRSFDACEGADQTRSAARRAPDTGSHRHSESQARGRTGVPTRPPPRVSPPPPGAPRFWSRRRSPRLAKPRRLGRSVMAARRRRLVAEPTSGRLFTAFSAPPGGSRRRCWRASDLRRASASSSSSISPRTRSAPSTASLQRAAVLPSVSASAPS